MLTEKIEKIIEKYQSKLSGPLGVGFYSFNDGVECFCNGESVIPAASTYKIYILMGLFRQLQEKKLSLTDRIILDDEDKSVGTGILYNLLAGAYLTVYDYAFLMMAISDNTAADILFRLVKDKNIYQNIIMPLGLSKTKVDLSCKEMITKAYGLRMSLQLSNSEYFLKAKIKCRKNPYFACLAAKNVETTSKDLICALRAIYNGNMFQEKSRETMLELMIRCETNERLPKFLPVGTKVAHKTGSLDRVTNDAGIVFTAYGAYSLVLLYNGNLASEEEYINNEGRKFSEPLLAQISSEIYSVFVKYYNIKE